MRKQFAVPNKRKVKVEEGQKRPESRQPVFLMPAPPKGIDFHKPIHKTSVTTESPKFLTKTKQSYKIPRIMTAQMRQKAIDQKKQRHQSFRVPETLSLLGKDLDPYTAELGPQK